MHAARIRGEPFASQTTGRRLPLVRPKRQPEAEVPGIAMRILQVISSVSPRLGGPAEVVLSLNTSYLEREVDACALSVDYASRDNAPLTVGERIDLHARTRGLRIFRRSRPY